MATGLPPMATAHLLAEELITFIDASPTPFHMCAKGGAMLLAAGFVELVETDAWRPLLKPGGKYFFVRGGTLVAFFIGAAFAAGNGFNIVGAHTDSPVLKLKPCSKKSAHGCIQINVEAYGGGLWHTWFDRELSLAGSVIVKEADGSFAKKLVHVRRPLLRIPNLCIHLTSADERGKFAPNPETHLQPILGLISEAVLAAELDCEIGAIFDFEMTLCDTQPSQIWGLRSELLSAPRLDNLLHCYTSLRALMVHADEAPPSADDVCMVALFDHEEVGSDSTTGAGGPIMSESMQRVSSCFAPDEPHAAAESLLMSNRRSFLISADAAHAVHPNYAEKHQVD
ncbi:aspartyl aminopeptidase [Chrysochromulina tobinii]|uniref:aspartyl aminopeptidase n=1 Tax=Chrysochromulina tobinii TaxID=1460289 RepID=A0A0M0JC10_9EUKA|nr:aspartyl aminopeptidase [Chrysochromulina tobinii]|eukprot:KOO24000.1 aspartyl aminopeptidase [Chrysochromulina sp. CCMP291]